MRIVARFVLAGLFVSPATAAVPVFEALPQVCPATGDVAVSFASAISASSFRTREGKEIKLAGLIGPGEDGEVLSTSDAATARSVLASFLSDQSLMLAVISGPDRYQRMNAEVFANGNWVQDAMLRKGLARVAPEPSTGACLAKLLNAEENAASNMTGHWDDGRFRIRTPDQVTGRAGKFEIVEGKVWRTAFTRGKSVIEFANASSFELTVSPDVARVLRRDRIDVRRLRGRILRVRGWIELDQKPAMELLRPDALQLIGKPARRR